MLEWILGIYRFKELVEKIRKLHLPPGTVIHFNIFRAVTPTMVLIKTAAKINKNGEEDDLNNIFSKT